MPGGICMAVAVSVMQYLESKLAHRSQVATHQKCEVSTLVLYIIALCVIPYFENLVYTQPFLSGWLSQQFFLMSSYLRVIAMW